MEKFNLSFHRVTAVKLEHKCRDTPSTQWIDVTLIFSDGSSESIALFGELSAVPPQLSFPRDSA